MPDIEYYTVLVYIDNIHRIVTVESYAEHFAGMAAFQTAWVNDPGRDVQPVVDPEDGHEIMTYDDRNQAIGEALTSLRDTFDEPQAYRPERKGRFEPTF